MNVFIKVDDTIVQIGIADENKKVKDKYSNIIDQAEGSLYSRRGEASSITSSVRSKVERPKLDELCDMEMEQKKAVCIQNVKKLETAKNTLEQKYQMELKQSDRKIETKNTQQFILHWTISDVSRDIDETENINSIELPGEICRVEEQQYGGNILFKKKTQRI